MAAYRVETQEAEDTADAFDRHEHERLDPLALELSALDAALRKGRHAGDVERVAAQHRLNRGEARHLQPLEPVPLGPGALAAPLVGVVHEGRRVPEEEDVAAVHARETADGRQRVVDAGVHLARRLVDELRRDPGHQGLECEAVVECQLRPLAVRDVDECADDPGHPVRLVAEDVLGVDDVAVLTVPGPGP